MSRLLYRTLTGASIARRSNISLLLLFPLAIASPVQASEPDAPLLSEAVFLNELPVVLSASRLPQSIADAPVATSIIDRQMILASGFTEIPDLLRLAPGFIVNYNDGHTQAVGYHLLADNFSRQMQVLVDGRSVYEPALGGVSWTDLPLTIDDIERIEVIRGPNAASYGANSFTAVINIITRHAVLDRGTLLKTNVGSNGLREGFLRHGGNHERLDFRVTAAWREDDGFDERHDYREVALITLRGDYQIDIDDSLMLQLGHNSGPKGEDNVFDELIPDHQKRTYSQFQQLRWTRSLSGEEEFSLQLYHNQNKTIDEYETSPMAALGGAQLIMDERLTSDRYDAEIQQILTPAASLRLVWGLGARRDTVNGPLFFNTRQDVENDSWRVFSNAEYHLSPGTLLNAGVMYEDSDTGGTHTSPRLSINQRLHRNHTLRLTHSRAYRDPFLFEESPDYRLQVPIPANVLLFDAGDIKSERITSWALGYIGNFPAVHTTLDARLFYDDLDDLITFERTAYAEGLGGTAQFFDNAGKARIKGIELSAQYQPGNGNRINISYTHQAIKSGTGDRQYDNAGPSDMLNLLGIHEFGRGYSASLGFYYLSKMKQLETNDIRGEQKRVDIRLARDISTAKRDYSLALVVQNLFDDEQETRLRNIIDRRAYGSVSINFK
ncbi:MAG: TonB-dependent receptor [Thiogranum sp.]|nr:TonB-dependent receptor [Thiogranum sp.]